MKPDNQHKEDRGVIDYSAGFGTNMLDAGHLIKLVI